MRTVNRRYYLEFLPAMAAYVLIMLLVWPMAARMESPWARAAIALLPVVPVLLVIRAIVRRIRGGDELERRLALESIAMAAALVGIVSFAVGFLAIARVVTVGGDILIFVLPALFLSYGLLRVWLTRRYLAA